MEAYMRIAYFDCFNGAAGDMIVAALLDAGADFHLFANAIESLRLPGYRLSTERIKKQGIAAHRFSVNVDDTQKPHRHLKHIIEIINHSGLSDRTKNQAVRIFTRLAEAEAKVHNSTIEKVHFHEVGAIDSIIDIVGACVALDLLNIERVYASAIPVGSGTIQCDHGIMPVPAPATAELLCGVPIAATDEPGELTTPTGAAILATLSSGFGSIPAMTTTAVGYGAGTREGRTRPNVIRVIIGTAQAGMDRGVERLMLLETNLDDVTPQIVAYCMQRLLAEGALDAWTQPIVMKKQRTATMLSVLCRMVDVEAMERLVFRETPTLGIRRREVDRTALPRRIEAVATKFGEIRMKVAAVESVESATPEYEDCVAAAGKHGVALREVIAEAWHAWRSRGNQK